MYPSNSQSKRPRTGQYYSGNEAYGGSAGSYASSTPQSYAAPNTRLSSSSPASGMSSQQSTSGRLKPILPAPGGKSQQAPGKFYSQPEPEQSKPPSFDYGPTRLPPQPYEGDSPYGSSKRGKVPVASIPFVSELFNRVRSQALKRFT